MADFLLEGAIYDAGYYYRRVLKTTQGKPVLITDNAFDNSLANVSNPFPITSPFEWSYSIMPQTILYCCDVSLTGLVFPNINPALQYSPYYLSKYYLPIHNAITCAGIVGYSSSRWNQYTQTISASSYVDTTQPGYQKRGLTDPDPDTTISCHIVMNLNATLSALRLHFAGTLTAGVTAWWEGQLAITFAGTVVMTASNPNWSQDKVYTWNPSFSFAYTLRKNCASDLSAHGVYSITPGATYSPAFIDTSGSPTITL